MGRMPCPEQGEKPPCPVRPCRQQQDFGYSCTVGLAIAARSDILTLPAESIEGPRADGKTAARQGSSTRQRGTGRVDRDRGRQGLVQRSGAGCTAWTRGDADPADVAAGPHRCRGGEGARLGRSREVGAAPQPAAGQPAAAPGRGEAPVLRADSAAAGSAAGPAPRSLRQVDHARPLGPRELW